MTNFCVNETSRRLVCPYTLRAAAPSHTGPTAGGTWGGWHLLSLLNEWVSVTQLQVYACVCVSKHMLINSQWESGGGWVMSMTDLRLHRPWEISRGRDRCSLSLPWNDLSRTRAHTNPDTHTSRSPPLSTHLLMCMLNLISRFFLLSSPFPVLLYFSSTHLFLCYPILSSPHIFLSFPNHSPLIS